MKIQHHATDLHPNHAEEKGATSIVEEWKSLNESTTHLGAKNSDR